MNVALQIRDVPEDVRDALARRAADAGLSLQKYLLEIVTREAGQRRNVELLKDLRPASALGAGTDWLAEARAERARQVEDVLE
ncbi:MAG TPA: hypothetical protein VEK80_17095 [Kribbellaceae bacterium]|nr:hypothetical protein [Kribbellaceae bacterium]